MIDFYMVISWVGVICVEVLLVPPAGAGQDTEGNAGAGGTSSPAQKGLWGSWVRCKGRSFLPAARAWQNLRLWPFVACVIDLGARRPPRKLTMSRKKSLVLPSLERDLPPGGGRREDK